MLMEISMKPLTRDRLGSLLMLVVIALLWSQRSYSNPLSGMFPDTVMAIMAVSIVVTLILSFTPYAAGLDFSEDATAQADNNTKQQHRHVARWRVFWVMLFLSLWVILFRSWGFAVTGLLGFTSIAWYLTPSPRRMRDLLICLGLAAVLLSVIYLVFDYFLGVPLPLGLLSD